MDGVDALSWSRDLAGSEAPRILVTGGAGYIGSHTCKQLAAAGYEPVTFDNLSTGHRWAVKWGPLVEGDLADPGCIRDALREYRVGAVIHFAASAYVGDSMQDPRGYFQNNVVNSLNLLGAMLDSKVSAIVFSSTCAIYGIPATIPIPEHHPCRPVNPYGESKLFVERVLHWYCRIYGLRWVALRYFNAAGADPDGELGEVHDPEPHIVPRAIQAALGHLPNIGIFGTDYPTPDGTAVRDYTHVVDLADAHVRSLRYLANAGIPCQWNLGSGKGHSVREVIAAVARISGKPVPVSEAPRREGDPPSLIADNSRVTHELGWTTKHSSLDEVVETAWRWHAR